MSAVLLIVAVAPAEMFYRGARWGTRRIPKPKARTEFQELYYAIVVYRLAENYANMRVKESHTDILWLL